MDYFESYTKSQIEKLGNTLVYLCNHMADLSKTHLLKLVFIIEEISVKKTGTPFFGFKFDLWKLGPVSPDLYVELSNDLNLLEDFIEKNTTTGYIQAKKTFCDDEFSDNDIALLEEVAKRFLYCTSTELVNYTHKPNSPWYNTAVRNGLLESLENGKTVTTQIEIDLGETIKDDPYKIAVFNDHKEFLRLSKQLKP